MQNDPKNLIKNQFYIPYLSTERSQKFFGIVLTLFALAFFGFFAIKPTVSTILKLQKEVSDNQLVLAQMKTKITNLTELRKQYFDLQGDLPAVTNAITVQPEVQLLFAQIQSIAKTSNIVITKLQNLEVEILRSNKNVNKDYYSYSFTIAGTGSFDNISKFMQTLTDMERVVNVDTFFINNAASQSSGSLGFNIQGTAFFKDSL